MDLSKLKSLVTGLTKLLDRVELYSLLWSYQKLREAISRETPPPGFTALFRFYIVIFRHCVSCNMKIEPPYVLLFTNDPYVSIITKNRFVLYNVLLFMKIRHIYLSDECIWSFDIINWTVDKNSCKYIRLSKTLTHFETHLWNWNFLNIEHWIYKLPYLI